MIHISNPQVHLLITWSSIDFFQHHSPSQSHTGSAPGRGHHLGESLAPQHVWCHADGGREEAHWVTSIMTTDRSTSSPQVVSCVPIVTGKEDGPTVCCKSCVCYTSESWLNMSCKCVCGKPFDRCWHSGLAHWHSPWWPAGMECWGWSSTHSATWQISSVLLVLCTALIEPIQTWHTERDR